MQEHQQDVYNSIHTENTQNFVPIHIYVERTQISPVYVAIHASRAQGVLHVCPYSYVQDITQDVLCPYIHAQKERSCYVYIKHDCAFTTEILCVW